MADVVGKIYVENGVWKQDPSLIDSEKVTFLKIETPDKNIKVSTINITLCKPDCVSRFNNVTKCKIIGTSRTPTNVCFQHVHTFPLLQQIILKNVELEQGSKEINNLLKRCTHKVSILKNSK